MPLRRVDPALDESLAALKSCHRREILYELDDAESDLVDLDELVDAKLAVDPGATDREEVIANLHHSQLPKLDEMGWIDFDRRSGTVRYRPESIPTEMLNFYRSMEEPD